MELSSRIKLLREGLGMDKHQLAKGVVSYSHLCNIESGRHIPSEDILIALAHKLKVPENYLLKYAEKDHTLDELLIAFKQSIDSLEHNKAKELLDSIHQSYPVIYSTYQETFFYILKCYYYFKINSNEKALELVDKEIIPLMEKVNVESSPPEFKETYYYIRANTHFNKEEYYKSYQYFILQYPLVKTNLQKAIISFNIALVLRRLNNLHTAIYYAEKALYLHLQERRWNKAAEADNLLGVLNWESRDLLNAEKHLLNSLEIVNQHGLVYLQGRVLHNLGLVYKRLNLIDKSIEHFVKSLEIKKKNNEQHTILITYNSIIGIYIEQNLLDNASSLLMEAEQYCVKEMDNIILKELKANLYLKSGQSAVYEAYMNECIEYFYQQQRWAQLKSTAEDLGNYYELNKKYKQSSKLFKLVILATKKIYEEDVYEKV